MIPIPVTATPKNVPSNYTVPNEMQGVLEAIAQYTDYEAQVSGPPVMANADGSGASLDSLWIWMLQGRFLAPRAMTGYRNNWWQVYTGKFGEIRTFCGPPGPYFDSSGYGIEATGWEGWAICNGNNGTVNLGHKFVVPGYRYASGQGWITNVGSALDQPGGEGPGGGGHGPGRIQGEVAYNTDLGISFTGPNVQAAQTAPVDAVTGGWHFFQIAPFNLGNGSGAMPFIGVNVELNMQGGSNNNYELIFVGHDAGDTASGGMRSVSPPGAPSAQQSFAGLWQYPIDQAPYMKDTPVSRLPPYIALGYVQFMGYK